MRGEGADFAGARVDGDDLAGVVLRRERGGGDRLVMAVDGGPYRGAGPARPWSNRVATVWPAALTTTMEVLGVPASVSW